MTPADWQRIADDIRDNYDDYDGFVILHGTDTMAYTASALSFMLENLDKPVIVTGSQIPLAELRSDGQANLLNALHIAANYPINEVTLFFNNQLLRGNRSTKSHADGFNAFTSPNLPPLVDAGINIQLHGAEIDKKPEALNGTYSNDNLNGTSGADIIFGYEGDDVIKGGAGDDTIYGGLITKKTVQLDRDTDSLFDVSGTEKVRLDLSSFSHSAGYNNSLGYYILDSNGNVISAVIIADNVKNISSLNIDIDTMGGVKVGLFLIPDGDRAGFNNGEVTLTLDGTPTVSQGSINSDVFVSQSTENTRDLDHEREAGDRSAWEDLRGLDDKDFNDTVFNVKVTAEKEVSDKDSIDGGTGNDTIFAGDDADVVHGGEGDDKIFGGKGDDTLHGDNGDDDIRGGEGNDIVYGGEGAAYQSDDAVKGNVIAGIEAVVGDEGNQTVTLNEFAIYAQSDDTERGDWDGFVAYLGEGDDTLRGYAGNDTAYGDSSASEIQDLTPNADGSYNLQSDTFVSVCLSQFDFATTDEDSLGYAILDASGNVISKNIIIDYVNLAERGSAIDMNTAGGVKLVFFTFPSSQLSGFEWQPFDLNAVDTNISTANVTIAVKEITSDTSAHGDDALYGYEGDDQLFGEGGNDSIVGGGGHDVISGGDGDDSAWGSDGDDHLHGGDGNDKLYGQNGKDKLEGGEGDDELWGGRDDDILLAGSGDDYIEGQDGNDTVQAGDGDDEVWGGSGNDNIRGDQGDDYINAESGDDLVNGGAGDDEIYGDDGNDDLRGSAGNDTIYGEQGNDILRGGAGNDYLNGGNGNDEVYGSLGTNTLLGGDGNDYLLAGWSSTDNYLDGQDGQDILIGGIGSDTLIFDEDDFQGQIKTLSNGDQINKHIYNASSGFDTLLITGAQHADFTGTIYQSDPNIDGNVIAGIEAVIGDSANQTQLRKRLTVLLRKIGVAVVVLLRTSSHHQLAQRKQ
eukprot:snap_masked-scaffold113_size352875-processed-gene-2.3 protein:Tk05240 transcript:snap_masked-scaffold113_size352875-processed-gene-2.3-mRNA-1 annotation:"hypothetical protein"